MVAADLGGDGIVPFGIAGAADAAGSGPRLRLRLSPGMQSLPIRLADGTRLGTLSGFVLRGHHGPGIGIGGDAITVSMPVPDATAFEKTVLDHLHGLYVIETHDALPPRLYPDAGGGVPLVYCPESHRVASSAGMMFDDAEYRERFLAERHKRLIEKEISGSWIVGRNTAHRGLYRVMPNFYLDLETWTTRRFWPRRGEFELGLPLETAAEQVATAMQGYVEAAVDQYGLVCPTFTAGFDSRLILAASRNVHQRMRFFTMGQPGDGLDQDITAIIAGRLGLNHVYVPVRQADAAQMALWDRLVGDVVSEINRKIWPTLLGLEGDLMFTGMYGETGRCRLYRYDAGTINDHPATAAFVLKRLTLPVDAELRPDIDDWVDGISWLPRSAVLDLAFNELRFGCWAMTQGPIQQALKLTMMPFAQRPIQAAFMAVPPLEKGTETLFTRIAELLWPETMTFAVNKYGDYRDVTAKLKKLFKRDHLVRFIRDRFA